MTPIETDLQSVVHSLLFSISEVDPYLVKEEQCNASCIRQLLVKLLKLSGYDAAVCSTRWQSADKVPGGTSRCFCFVLDNLHASHWCIKLILVFV